MKSSKNKPFIPYTYLIGWSNKNFWYYGSEYGTKKKIANPENLWVTYFTSSKVVKEIRNLYGEPDIIQIRKIFKCPDKTRNWEHKVLRRLKVTRNQKWLNLTDNKAIINSEETYKLIARKTSKALKGKPKSKEQIEKIRATKIGKIPKSFQKFIQASQTEESRKKRNESISKLIWVTNGIENKRVSKDFILEKGWSLGRNFKRTIWSDPSKASESNKGRTTVYDLYLNTFVKISKEEFRQNKDRYCGTASKRIPKN